MAHVVVLGRIHEAGLELLRARADVTFEMVDEPTRARILEAVRRAEAVVLRPVPFDREIIEAAPRLRVVSRHGVGFDSVDLEALSRRRIPLAVTSRANRVAVAEHTLFLLLAVAKRALLYHQAAQAGDFAVRERLPTLELHGCRLLLVGFGRIGREVARRAGALGMQLLAFDPHLDDAVFAAAGVERVLELDAALPTVDVVSLHLPYQPGSPPLFDRARLARLRPGAILINTARGALVDEHALAEALREGRLFGAGIDVFSQEPPPADHPLLHAPHVVLSPHAAAWSAEAMRRMAVEAVANALAVLDGRLDPEVIVNLEAITRPRAGGGASGASS